jgi:uncharacterized protein YggE
MRRIVGVAAVLGALLAPVPALAQPASGQTVTATGTGQAAVHPTNRHSNASIVAAVAAARPASVTNAFAVAKQNAGQYASAAGLTLGSVQSVSDVAGGGYFGPGPYGGPGGGPFGPNQYCGTVREVVGRVKIVHGRKRFHLRKVHRCFVPSFVYATLVVTWTASPSS